MSIAIAMSTPSCLKKNLSACGSLPWRRHLLLPVHHHTELFVAELVVLQMYFLFVFFLLLVDINLVFYSTTIPFTPDENQFISTKVVLLQPQITLLWSYSLKVASTSVLLRRRPVLWEKQIGWNWHCCRDEMMNTIRVFCILRLTCEAIMSSCFEM